MSRLEERRECWFGTPPERWPEVARQGRGAYIRRWMLSIAPTAFFVLFMEADGSGERTARLARIGGTLLSLLVMAILVGIGAHLEWSRLVRKYGMPEPEQAPEA